MNVITDTDELARACKMLGAQPFATVDTEFLRENTFWPQLCLIQMAGPEGEFIVDPLSDKLNLAPFFELMANEATTKVFHAGRQDLEIIHALTRKEGAGIIPKPLFDTQVAAMVCGFGESIGYVNLVKRILGHELDKGARFTDWSRRPLSPKQLTYALADVTHLRDVYTYLANELEATKRTSWVAEEMATLSAPETYAADPDLAWRRLKMRVKNRRALAVMMELAAWRDRQAQSQDVPRSRILRDEALYDIANQSPTDPSKLGQLRTLSDGFARSARAKEIVAVVKAGLDRDMATVPKLNTGNALTPEATAISDLLRVLLKACAARHRVATKLIADSSDLDRIASEDEPDVIALKGWRRELFGEEALRVKRGEVAVTVIDGEITTVPRG
ncbi:MAG: ribonuclease D [Hyphomicrobiaceae bacterium]|jgi:ribonuclease D